MRTLVHISDLHFGRVDLQVVDALRTSVNELAPDVIAVSGDLTQRAKAREFCAARNFLHSLDAPKVVVPGNHDIPLYDLFARFGAPLERYRRYLGEEVESAFVDEQVVVVGVNTARSSVFKGGRINMEQVRRARDLLCAGADSRVRVLVTHHPFHLDGASPSGLVGRAELALRHLRECMPDVLLAGHMHAHEIGFTAQRYNLGGRSALVVQAGTATSTRGRGQQNSFNVLHLELHRLTVQPYQWVASRGAFAPGPLRRYVRHGRGWRPEGAA